MVPLACSVHFCAPLPPHVQRFTAVPFAVPPPLTLTHLPLCGLTRVLLVYVHLWFQLLWQSNSCSRVPSPVAWPVMSTHRPLPVPTICCPLAGGGADAVVVGAGEAFWNC